MSSFFRRPPHMSYDDYVAFIVCADMDLRRLLTFFPDTDPDAPLTYDRSTPLNMRDDPGFDLAGLDDVMVLREEGGAS